MIIRKATIKDSHSISEHLFLAMESILYEFIGTNDAKKAKELLSFFAEKENNQYSYQNCLVAEIGSEIVGAINIYDGAKLNWLREPIVQYLKSRFDRPFTHGDETQEGEYYIDTFGVSPSRQGKGIGTQILKSVINEYVDIQQQTIGLLVDEGNPNAEKVYLKLGFGFEGEKEFAGKKMKHLQIKPGKSI